MKSPGGASSNASINSASLISPKPGSNYGYNSTGGSIRDHSPQSRGGGGRSSSGASPPTMNAGSNPTKDHHMDTGAFVRIGSAPLALVRL